MSSMQEDGTTFAAYERSVVNGVSFSTDRKAVDVVIEKYLLRLITPKNVPGMMPACMPREPSTIIQLFSVIDSFPKGIEETPNLDTFNALRWQMIAESFGLIENQPEWLIVNAAQRKLIMDKQNSNKYKNETVGHFGLWLLRENSGIPALIPTGLVWEFLLYGASARQREWFNFGQIYHFRYLPAGTTFTGNIWQEDFRKMQYFSDPVESAERQALVDSYLKDCKEAISPKEPSHSAPRTDEMNRLVVGFRRILNNLLIDRPKWFR